MSVLITGAANGLGASLSSFASEQGHTIVGLDYQWDDPTNALQVTADLSEPESIATLAPVLSAKGPYDIVIHNAAVSATGKFEDIPASAHQRLLDINVSSPLLLTKKLLADGAIKRGGTLVFIASLSVYVGYPGAASYAASKMALSNYAKSLRKALKADGINVLTVYPGPMKTEQASRHAPKGANAEKRMNSDEVAKQIFSAIDQRKSSLVPSAANKIFAKIGTLFPRSMKLLMKKIIYDKLDGSVY
ncbi:MAG: SDR family NAD(P)-dependent oxidoreductase [Hyphomicrobiales bacterium]